MYPIHKNLNTSFVNLSALVLHLRSIRFVGTLRLELPGYEADVEFTGTKTMRACETDHDADRITYGEKAFQRILNRAKEPGGLINVYQSSNSEAEKKIFVDKSIVLRANRTVSGNSDMRVTGFGKEKNGGIYAHISYKGKTDLADNVNREEPKNWGELLVLISELLRTVDETLSQVNINFEDAFRNACGFVSSEHPFLDPESDVFSYAGGFIGVRQKISERDLTSGIVTALGRILGRLAEDEQFEKIHRLTIQRIRMLARRREPQFERFSIAAQLQAVIGI